MTAPNKCPMCKKTDKWTLVDQTKKGFSLGKAALGGFLLGPVGLLGGKKYIIVVEIVDLSMNIMHNKGVAEILQRLSFYNNFAIKLSRLSTER